MRTFMMYTKKLFYLLGVLVVVLAFQNCSMQAPLKPVESLSMQESGNGGGYEGKPDGTYYYFIPNYSCNGSPVAEQIAEIKNGQASLYDNKGNQCAGQSSPISIEDINLSPFQKEFISVKDALFKRYDEKPTGIPENLAEVLCRDNYENPTFEIVSHYDRENNEARTRIYTPTGQVPDFAVSRLLSSSEVRYVANKISFKVDLSKPSFPEKKYAGQLENSTVTGLKTQPLVCVIGGSIDKSKWSLKVLTDQKPGGFQLLSNDEIVFFSEVSRHYFSSYVFSTVTHLFKIGLDQVVSDFSKVFFGENYDITSTIGKAGDFLYFYGGKLTSEMWTSILVYDVRTGKTKRLTNLNPGAEPEAYFMSAPVITEDEHVFYDTMILHNDMSRSVVVRVYNLKDDSIADIALYNEGGETGYLALPKTNRLLLFWQMKNNVRNVIEIYDAQTKKSKDLVLQMAGNCIVNGFDAQHTNDETTILAAQTCGDSKRDVVQISLADGQVKIIGADSKVSWASDDLNRYILTTAGNENFAYDIRTGQTTKLNMDPVFGLYDGKDGATDFSISRNSSKIALVGDRFLYGFGGNIDSPTMYQVDLNSGVHVKVCEAAAGKKMFVGKLPDQKVFLFTYDSQLKVYRFYHVKSPADCARINEFPSEFTNVPSLMPTSIGFSMLLGRPLTLSSTNVAAEAVFVPIDGRPPLKFNSDTKGSWGMDVSIKRNRIILQGPDTDNVVKLFSFDL